MLIGPALPLSLLVAAFHTALYVLLRGSLGARLPLVFAAAALGAWAGDRLGGRLGLELGALGDYRLVSASVVAWVGIGVVALLAVLGPERPAVRVRRARR